jgi:hypothetical protein
MWKNTIFCSGNCKKGTSSLHREMEKGLLSKFAYGEANLSITDAPYCVRSEEYLRWLKYIIIPRSGVMETKLDELVSHENITIHIDFMHMAANLNYNANPCGNIPTTVHGHE